MYDYYQSNQLPDGIYLMHLRKSRKDNPLESVEEVLAKHEVMLQNLAQSMLGRKIEEQYIIREVASGESIAEREDIKRTLAMIENPDVRGVFCMDGSRLTRGDLMDCGKIVSVFKVTKTLIITHTPSMVYNLENKMHRKFFEQELLRGNDYLEYSKDILLRGRHNAVGNKGSYIGNIAPFGYDKCEDDIGPTLKPNALAEAVKLVFNMYVNEDKNYLEIARNLDSI